MRAKRGSITKFQIRKKRPKTVPSMRHDAGEGWKPIAGKGSTEGGDKSVEEDAEESHKPLRD